MATITLKQDARAEVFEALANLCEDEQLQNEERIAAAELLITEGLRAAIEDSVPHQRAVAFLRWVIAKGGPQDKMRAATILLQIPAVPGPRRMHTF